ncbi:hypothetical protein DH2020_045321 [Rehmannia glutinosa]|uniref:Squalene synthase n=1 Tax=Rehmannia glutinosa TaxID=99300 RepID=A0ABR0UEH0_REHGL
MTVRIGEFSHGRVKMVSLRAILRHPDDLYPMVKLKLAARQAEKQIPPEPHWAFCYTMLHKVSRSFGLVIQQLDTDLRDADDTSIATEVKVPILMAFHRHIYDREWHFSCGTKEYKVLMDEFHHVSTAFLELGSGYQEAIEDITMRMGAGMAKFICKEDLKYEENSVKAVQCLNDMVTNALAHVEDCLKYMSALRDPANFRFCAIPQIMAIGTLALCYNNVEVFRGVVKMRRGLTAKVIDRTKTMSDVYGAFYDFSLMLKSKVDESDPNARKTKDSLETILKICRDSGTLSQRCRTGNNHVTKQIRKITNNEKTMNAEVTK